MPGLVSFASILELRVCQRPSENAGSERTTIICSNSGVGHQNNACMKGSAPSPCSASLQQNGLKKPAWRKGAAPSRVVVLSSSGHRFSDVHFDDLQYRHRPYGKWEAYGQSKTANALFAVGLTQHVGYQGIMANAVNPGGTRTGLQQHLTPEEMRALGWLDEADNVTSRLKTPEQGAATSVWAAVGHELDGVGGRYLENCQEAAPLDPGVPFLGHGYLPYALDPEHAERLWTVSQELVGR